MNIVTRLNAQLPAGLRVIDCLTETAKPVQPAAVVTTYRLVLDGGGFADDKIDAFLQQPQWIVSRTNRKGKTSRIDLRHAVVDLARISPSELALSLRSSSGRVPRPADVVAHLFDLSPGQINRLRVIKLASEAAAADH
jgi:hypothetical protein